MAIPTTLFSSLYVHGVLEITYDVKILTNLAVTNKAMWTACKTLTTTGALNTKVWTNIPERSRQVGRPVPREDLRPPVDMQHFLYNRRMHEWIHHHLPYHQFMHLHVRHVLQG